MFCCPARQGFLIVREYGSAVERGPPLFDCNMQARPALDRAAAPKRGRKTELLEFINRDGRQNGRSRISCKTIRNAAAPVEQRDNFQLVRKPVVSRQFFGYSLRCSRGSGVWISNLMRALQIIQRASPLSPACSPGPFCSPSRPVNKPGALYTKHCKQRPQHVEYKWMKSTA